MTSLTADNNALLIDTQDGEIVMTGPRVAVALTPAAAAETARRLAAAATQVGSADAVQASQTDPSKA